MIHLTGAINYLSLIAATLAAFALGAFWYSPILFGNRWFKTQGILPEHTKEESERLKRPSTHIIAVFLMLIVGYVLSFFLRSLQVTSITDALYVGFISWLGFTGAIGCINTVYENRSFSVFIVHSIYCLAYIELMAVIMTMWP